MDFADLDLRAASERGSWVVLQHPRIPKGEEPKLRILGMGAASVMDAFRKVERIETLRRDRLARAADANAEAVLAKSQSELEAAMADMIVAAVSEWEGIEYNKEKLACTRENILTICGPGTLFFGQVTDAIREEHRLFTSADSA